MDASLISAAVGALGGLFGSRRPNNANLEQNLALTNDIIRRATELYDRTDLAANDAQTITAFRENAMRDAMAAAMNYDARAASAGSNLYKSDTAKDRARNQIFADQANRTATLEAELNSTRPQRQASLLPNPNAAAAGTQAAAILDQQTLANNAATADLIGSVGTILGQIYGRRGQSAGQQSLVSPTQNDRTDPKRASFRDPAYQDPSFQDRLSVFRKIKY
jgi:hypothetical protein